MRTVRKERPHLLHTHMVHGDVYGALAATTLRLPFVSSRPQRRPVSARTVPSSTGADARCRAADRDLRRGGVVLMRAGLPPSRVDDHSLRPRRPAGGAVRAAAGRSRRHGRADARARDRPADRAEGSRDARCGHSRARMRRIRRRGSRSSVGGRSRTQTRALAARARGRGRGGPAGSRRAARLAAARRRVRAFVGLGRFRARACSKRCSPAYPSSRPPSAQFPRS